MRIGHESERLQKVVRQYREADMPWPATTREVAAWAINAGLWEPRHEDSVAACARHLGKAMAREHYVDPQGRSVRTKHAMRTREEGQLVFIWDDIRTAEEDHMRTALQQRRLHIAANCRQLQSDVDSYNENRIPEHPVTLCLDFSEDVAEAAAFEQSVSRGDRSTVPEHLIEQTQTIRPNIPVTRSIVTDFPPPPQAFV